MEKALKNKTNKRQRAPKISAKNYAGALKKLHYVTGSYRTGTSIRSAEYDLDVIMYISHITTAAVSSIIIQDLMNSTELSANNLANIFEMTVKTLGKYKNEKLKLPIRAAELTVKLELLYSLGVKLFGSVKEFNQWLNTESYGLNDKKPIEMLNTVTGINAVSDELKRIEYGATA